MIVKDTEDNHLLVREELHAFSIIPARYEHVPIWRTYEGYTKQMKRGDIGDAFCNISTCIEDICSNLVD